MPPGIYVRTKDSRVTVVCPCGVIKKVFPCKAATTKYCSSECLMKYRPKMLPCKPGCACDRHAKTFSPPVCTDGVCTVYTNRHGIPFTVDESDLESVLCRSWYISNDPGYPATTLKVYGHPTIKQRIFFLHNYLLGSAPDGLEWDHIDRNPLNNQRNNFRAVTHSVNCLNGPLRYTNTTGAKCVYKDGNQWTASILVSGEKNQTRSV